MTSSSGGALVAGRFQVFGLPPTLLGPGRRVSHPTRRNLARRWGECGPNLRGDARGRQAGPPSRDAACAGGTAAERWQNGGRAAAEAGVRGGVEPGWTVARSIPAAGWNQGGTGVEGSGMRRRVCSDDSKRSGGRPRANRPRARAPRPNQPPHGPPRGPIKDAHPRPARLPVAPPVDARDTPPGRVRAHALERAGSSAPFAKSATADADADADTNAVWYAGQWTHRTRTPIGTRSTRWDHAARRGLMISYDRRHLQR